jgi:hypothetical protein
MKRFIAALLYYCEKQIIHKWIVSDFSFGDGYATSTSCMGRPRHADATCDSKNGVKNLSGANCAASQENAIRKYLNFPRGHTFFKKFSLIMA